MVPDLVESSIPHQSRVGNRRWKTNILDIILTLDFAHSGVQEDRKSHKRGFRPLHRAKNHRAKHKCRGGGIVMDDCFCIEL